MKHTFSNENSTRRITIDGNYIRYYLKCDGGEDVFTMNDELLKILRMDCITPTRGMGRLLFRIKDKGAEMNYYCYDVALAAYQGRVCADTFIEDMRKWYDEKNANESNVDHADSNIHNNTVYNLSLMSRPQNNRKGSVAVRIKPPYKLVSIFKDGVYRVWYGFRLSAGQIDNVLKKLAPIFRAESYAEGSISYICEDAESYIECLTGLPFVGIEGLPPMRDEKNNGKWRSEHAISEMRDINRSLMDEERLANVPENRFEWFDRGHKQE